MAALRDQITIEKFTYVSDSTGTVDQTWATHTLAWADINQVTGSENFTSDMDVYDDVKSFQIPYVDGSAVTPRMRVKYDSEYYYITSITKQKRLWVKLIAVRNDDE